MYIVYAVIGIVLMSPDCWGQGPKKYMRVGAVFHHDNPESEQMFTQQLQKRSNMYEGMFSFVPHIQKVSKIDSFKSGKIACNMTENGVGVIFGPQERECDGIVESICHNLQIPHFSTHWDPVPATAEFSSMSIRMFPDAEVLAKAYADFIHAMEWTRFTIIYESDDALIRLQEIFRNQKLKDGKITVRQVDQGPDYRPLLKEVKAAGDVHIVIDASPQATSDILNQALELKMLGEYMHYFLLSLDVNTVDFGSAVRDDLCNITSLRMVNPANPDVKRAVYDLSEKLPHITEDNLSVEMALLHDAVDVFYHGLIAAEVNETVRVERVSCDGDDTWTHGERLYTYLREVQIDGLTGPIQFDEEGRRTYFQLEFTELISAGYHYIATWDPVNRIVNNKTAEETAAQYSAAIKNKVFRVASRAGPPFLWFNKSLEHLGNEAFRGYSVDLIQKISELNEHFKYEFYLVKDGEYGSLVNGKWNGLIKDLLLREADLAICDLTITYDRRTAVDFTMPFMTLGISILFQKPVTIPPALFSFLDPLSFAVWVYTATAFLGVSFFLYIIARMCPKDWENPHPCNPEPEELETIWCLKNCIWLSTGSFMCQGSDLLPKGSSTRVATACWWFFALIVTQSYCANLTAFLTAGRMEETIENAEGLARQTKIKYGAIKGGSTGNFFRDSNHSTYQRMWSSMESTRPSVFVKSNPEGVDRVRSGKGKYAFLMESTSIEYTTERDCTLTQIGGKLDSKGYGIAMPKNSPYRTKISKTVLKLQEDGVLLKLKNKWWKEQDGGGACPPEGDKDANEMGIENVAGVFVLLGCGCAAAFLMSILEFLWNVRKVAVTNKLTPLEALTAELKFAIKIFNKTKPVNMEVSESTNSEDADTRSIAASMLRGASSFLRLDQMFNDKNSRL